MYRALLDTNVLLDLFVIDRGRAEAAEGLFSAIDAGKFEGFVLASSLKDFYYIARRSLTDVQRRQCIEIFMDALTVLPIDEVICRAAVRSNEPDFEDGIIRVAAEAYAMDAIVSNDELAFADSDVLTVTSAKMLSLLS